MSPTKPAEDMINPIRYRMSKYVIGWNDQDIHSMLFASVRNCAARTVFVLSSATRTAGLYWYISLSSLSRFFLPEPHVSYLL
ncbi:MAG: hypothetical protein QXE05_02010 [Nitrososphaeria archaeon]